MTPRLRIPVLLFLGSLLAQVAWILALPQFRGIDEFDHAYRAAAVASGQWKPEYVAAANGRGDLLVVPKSLVQAAEPVCAWYAYTGPDNCRPVEELGRGQVTIASGAARYSPVFYWVIGKPAALFEGTNSLYAMRGAAALLCSAFIALAGYSLSFWTRTPWPYAGLLVALSPVAVYTTAVAAPNGLEICAGLALWASLLGVTRSDLSAHATTRIILASAPAGVALSSVRQLGPLFLFLTTATILILVGRKRALRLLRKHRRSWAFTGALTGSAALANLWWVQSVSSLTLEKNGQPNLDLIGTLVAYSPLWLLQTIAVFPTHNERAPTPVYAVWLVVFFGLLSVGLKLARSRLRVTLFLAMAISLTVPLLLTALTYGQAGPIWQGRYGLPFMVGLPLLAALALDERGTQWGSQYFLGAATGAAMLMAHVVGITSVLEGELRNSPLSETQSWIMPSHWIVATLMSAGVVAWWTAVRLAPSPSIDSCAQRAPLRSPR